MAVAIFTTADATHLGLMAIIIIAAAFFMSSLGQIVNVTVGALLAYAIANIILTLVTAGGDVMTLIQQSWDALLALDFKTFLVWFLAFGVLIAIINTIIGLVLRR
jgi:hypothetical protein